MVETLMAGLACASISFTITKSALFKQLRIWLREPLIITCPYCFSHWVAFGLAINISDGFMAWIIQAFAIITIANMAMITLVIAMEHYERHG